MIEFFPILLVFEVYLNSSSRFLKFKNPARWTKKRVNTGFSYRTSNRNNQDKFNEHNRGRGQAGLHLLLSLQSALGTPPWLTSTLADSSSDEEALPEKRSFVNRLREYFKRAANPAQTYGPPYLENDNPVNLTLIQVKKTNDCLYCLFSI